MKKVFLGGTCNGSTWRNQLIERLKIDYFNPVVDDWTESAFQCELFERENCDYCLYVITPKMTGVYSIAEVIDDANNRPHKTIFSVMRYDEDLMFNYSQFLSLQKVGEMVKLRGGKYVEFEDLHTVLV